jgi:hypothetical protein
MELKPQAGERFGAVESGRNGEQGEQGATGEHRGKGHTEVMAGSWPQSGGRQQALDFRSEGQGGIPPPQPLTIAGSRLEWPDSAAMGKGFEWRENHNGNGTDRAQGRRKWSTRGPCDHALGSRKSGAVSQETRQRRFGPAY